MNRPRTGLAGQSVQTPFSSVAVICNTPTCLRKALHALNGCARVARSDPARADCPEWPAISRTLEASRMPDFPASYLCSQSPEAEAIAHILQSLRAAHET